MVKNSRKRSQKKRCYQRQPETLLEMLNELLGKPLQLMSMCLRVAERLGMSEHWLTSATEQSHAVLMLTMGKPTPRSKLVLAGIHGDEPAGVIGLLSFLFLLLKRPGLRRQVGSFALIPMMSPSAFELQTRRNAWDEDANRGFRVAGVPISKTDQGEPSFEGKILFENLSHLSTWAQHSVLALHEDSEAREFYLYDFNETQSPSNQALMLRDCGAKLFGVVPDNNAFEGSVVRNGIILNHVLHGALDELFFERFRVPVFVTETPGLCDLDKRAEASLRLIQAFLSGNG
jgi:predicted deacylase